MRESEIHIQAYKKNLDAFKNLVIEEMAESWKDNEILIDWIESEKRKFFLIMEQIDELDELISDIHGDLKLDLPFIKKVDLRESLGNRFKTLEKSYKVFFEPKQMIWNSFKRALYNYEDAISRPDAKRIRELSSFKKVESRFIHFNETSEYISDIQVELENEIKNANRSLGEFNEIIKDFNHLIRDIVENNSNAHVVPIKNLVLKQVQIREIPKIERKITDLEKLKEKIRNRGKVQSKLIRDLSPELKELQKIQKDYQSERKALKEKKQIKIIQMSDIFLPLDRENMPIYDINTGRLLRNVINPIA